MKLWQRILLGSAHAKVRAIESAVPKTEERLTAAAKGAAQEVGARNLTPEQLDRLAPRIARAVLRLEFGEAPPTTGDLYEAGAASVREVMAHGR